MLFDSIIFFIYRNVVAEPKCVSAVFNEESSLGMYCKWKIFGSSYNWNRYCAQTFGDHSEWLWNNKKDCDFLY